MRKKGEELEKEERTKEKREREMKEERKSGMKDDARHKEKRRDKNMDYEIFVPDEDMSLR